MTNTLQQVRELIKKKIIIIPKGNIEGDLQMSYEKHNEILHELLFDLNSLPSEWISVTDENPPLGTDVLVYSEGTMCVDSYFTPNSKTYRNGFSRDSEATHWMPLPLPPSP